MRIRYALMTEQRGPVELVRRSAGVSGSGDPASCVIT